MRTIAIPPVKQSDEASTTPADVVIEVQRGMVIAVYTDITDLHVVLVDWDDDDREPTECARTYSVTPIEALPEETRAEIARSSHV